MLIAAGDPDDVRAVESGHLGSIQRVEELPLKLVPKNSHRGICSDSKPNRLV
jgi:hypothetical protein